MLHVVWWFFFGYLGFRWGTPRRMWMGVMLCSHCSAWLGKWTVPCFADFMGAVRCCLLLKKLRMSRNDRVPMLPVALVAVNHVSFPWKKPSKTIQDRQFCRIWCNMQDIPHVGFSGLPMFSHPKIQRLLWRPATKSSCPAGEAGGCNPDVTKPVKSEEWYLYTILMLDFFCIKSENTLTAWQDSFTY